FFAGVEERSSRLREDASDESSEARAARSRCCAAAAASTAYASVRRKTFFAPARVMQRLSRKRYLPPRIFTSTTETGGFT
ncbi:MAG TPA: hypothetical protein VFF06_05070, partial [Polyangia bacterium]|nr:hypothetical protein [Polyangia bacterium]